MESPNSASRNDSPSLPMVTRDKAKGIQTFISKSSKVRRQSAFHYEEYLKDAEEVKVYVGSENLFHAEIRDIHNVKKDENGQEIRQITELSDKEKIIAGKIQKAIDQRMFGFDMMRSGGKSYVIDLNEFVIPKAGREEYLKQVSIELGKYRGSAIFCTKFVFAGSN